MQYALYSLGELDGELLLRTGRGIESLNPRQLCNVVFARLMQDRDADQRKEIMEELTASLDPMEQADKVWKQLRME